MSGHNKNTRGNGEGPNKKSKVTQEQEHKEVRQLVLSQTRIASEKALFLCTQSPTTTCPDPGCDHVFVVKAKLKAATCACGVRFCWPCHKIVDPGAGTWHWCHYGYLFSGPEPCKVVDCLHYEGGCMINFDSPAEAKAFAARPFLRILNLYNLRLILIDARRHRRGIWKVSLTKDLLKLIWAFLVY